MHRVERTSTYFQVPVVMPPANKPNPAMGVRTLSMSATGRYLATVNDSQRAAVWLWDLHVLSLVCVLKHEQPVVSLMWDPVRNKLAICTASRRCAITSPRPFFTDIGDPTNVFDRAYFLGFAYSKCSCEINPVLHTPHTRLKR